jgi:hypothetical protein
VRKTVILTATAVVLALLSQCHKKQKSELAGWNAHCELQTQAGRLYDSLAGIGDTSVAIDSTVAFLRSSSSVAWAVYNGCNGISVRYTDRIPGIVLTSEDDAGGDIPESTRTSGTGIAGGVLPSKNGAAYYSPLYTEHEPARQVYDAMRHNLPKVGYPDAVDLCKDNEVTLDRLASIPGRGVLQFFGHGMPYPEKTNISEVYFVAGEAVNANTDSEYADEIDSGDVPLVTETEKNTYAVSPAFLKTHNDSSWAAYHPLVYGSFCYSSRGTWASTMADMGASCYLGWDDEVRYPENHAWACSLYTFMCDTPCHEPYTSTVSGFMWKYIYYYWHTGQTGAMLHISGDPSTTFQQPVPEGWYVDGRYAVFGFAGANMLLDGELDISFGADSSIPPHFPIAAITIYDGSAVAPGSTVWPDDFGICFSETDVYGNEPWMTAPLYVYFTEANFTPPLGKVSGLIEGSVFRIGDTLPLPIHGSFSNVTVNCLLGTSPPRTGHAAITAAIHNVSKRTDAARQLPAAGGSPAGFRGHFAK